MAAICADAKRRKMVELDADIKEADNIVSAGIPCSLFGCLCLARQALTHLSACDAPVHAQIKKMDNEAGCVAPDKSKALKNKVKEYKADLASLKEQLIKARSAVSDVESARAELVRCCRSRAPCIHGAASLLAGHSRTPSPA
jgi:vesicle transport through interaction with t-SNAREs protein 1